MDIFGARNGPRTGCRRDRADRVRGRAHAPARSLGARAHQQPRHRPWRADLHPPRHRHGDGGALHYRAAGSRASPQATADVLGFQSLMRAAAHRVRSDLSARKSRSSAAAFRCAWLMTRTS